MNAPPNRPRVLVADDDEIMGQLLEALLGARGYQVTAVPSGDEAVALLAARPAAFDAVLTDLHMPGLQGVELARTLVAQREPRMTLLAMSGSRPSDEEVSLFDAFLPKPFGIEEFEAALEKARGRPNAKLGNTVPFTESASTAVPVLNEEIYARLCGMLTPAQLAELYRVTLTDVRDRVERMRASEAAGDHDAVRREAHAIKGGCGMMGATELAALAANTEGGADGGTTALADFTAACARLEGMLNARLSSSS